MPAVLTWLWRDYDSAKTEQIFEQDAAEKAKPVFRVKIYNRD
jgi:enterochelin esterase family protein